MSRKITNKELIETASEVMNPKLLGDYRVGNVGSALVTDKRTVFQGVCLDVGGGLGFCAERTAISQMLTKKEYKVVKIVAVWNDNPEKELYVLPPCGACREFMRSVCEDGLEIDIVLGSNKTVKLRDLLPYNEWPESEIALNR